MDESSVNRKNYCCIYDNSKSFHYIMDNNDRIKSYTLNF